MGMPCPNGCDNGTVYVNCARCEGTGEETIINEDGEEQQVSCAAGCDNGTVSRTCTRCKGSGEI